jgi:hypothetical protein
MFAGFQSGDTAVVQADEDFLAPDGHWYRSAIGPVTMIRAKDVLGFEPRNSANWFAQIGINEKAVVIAGCRIHYAIPFPPRELPPNLIRNAWDAR